MPSLSAVERTNGAGEKPVRLAPAWSTDDDLGAIAPLPTPPTALVGRERELATGEHLLRPGGARLLTLTGPGGVGKTRFAIEAATRARTAFPDGVAFVPLATVATPDLVLPTIAQALGVRE